MIEGILRDDSTRPSLRALTLPARLLITLFLLGVTAALLAGEGNVAASHGDADGKPGISREDLVLTYHGRPGWTLLASKIDGGSMRKHIPIPSERAAVIAWARSGAPREGFPEVRTILDRRCVKCHSPGNEKEESPFAEAEAAGARYELVTRYTRPDRGMSTSARATTTHAHLFALSTLFGLMGAVFLLTNTARRTKVIAVALPYAGMFLGIGSWWAALWSPAFVWTVAAGGALMALGTAILVLRPLWEMWGPRPKGLRV